MENAETFGEFFHKRRMALNLTLRHFCTENNLDPGNISRIENDILPAPENSEKLKNLAHALRIKEDSAQWDTFFALARLSRGKIPEGLNKKVISLLPALCRKKDGTNLTKEEIEKLIELIKEPPSEE